MAVSMLWATLLWAGALGCGLMAGVYFTFSAFVMRALGALPTASGMAAMRSINVWIVQSAFMPLFFLTTLLSLGLLATLPHRSSLQGAGPALAGGGVYLLGMFAVTVWIHVPLNRALDNADASATETATLFWQHYLKYWTRWNHVRTLASGLASGLFGAAMLARNSP